MLVVQYVHSCMAETNKKEYIWTNCSVSACCKLGSSLSVTDFQLRVRMHQRQLLQKRLSVSHLFISDHFCSQRLRCSTLQMRYTRYSVCATRQARKSCDGECLSIHILKTTLWNYLSKYTHPRIDIRFQKRTHFHENIPESTVWPTRKNRRI